MDALAASGVLAHHDNPQSLTVDGMWEQWARSPQHRAYTRALRLPEVQAATWGCFLDIDEFLVLRRHETVAEFAAEFPDSDAIGINWHVFGSSGQVRAEPGLVIERFTHASKPASKLNALIKTLFRMQSVRAQAGAHWVHLHAGKRYTNTAGQLISTHNDPSAICVELGKINHYAVKSREEYAVRRMRGDVNVFPSDSSHTDKYNDACWLDLDRNEIMDDLALGHVERVKAGIARLMRLPGVTEAMQVVTTRWRAMIETA